MGLRAWSKVSALHARPCPGTVSTYTYRYYGKESPMYERCVSLGWCAVCREYVGQMVHVPRRTDLADPLADLNPDDRAVLIRSEHRLIDHLDRLVRRGDWPPLPR